MKISTLINYIKCLPENYFSRYQNGVIQVYGCALGAPLRGNLYLNNTPALNYYIYTPDRIELCFVINNDSTIGFERFTFYPNDDLTKISKAGKEYSITQDIVSYFENLLTAKVGGN